MSILESLDDEKKVEAIRNEGNTLVIANPGTGKTTAIVYKYLSLLEQGVEQKDILCITFTEKAKSEMLERILEVAEERGIKLDISELHIHTFHSFAYNYLENHVKNVPKELADETDLRYLVYKFLVENKIYNYGNEYVMQEFVPAIVSNIRFIKSYGVLPESIDVNKAREAIKQEMEEKREELQDIKERLKELEAFVDAYRRYEEWKESRTMDYNDMLLLFVKHFEQNHKFKHVLVDELQDVNDVEANIALNVGNKIFAVGDRKQAIFGFQGGAYTNFEKFSSKKGFREFNLSKNRRSTQAILDYAKALFLKHTHKPEDFEDELRDLRSNKEEYGEKVKIVEAVDAASYVINRIREVLGKDASASIGIIARKNAQLVELSEALDAYGMEHTLYTETSTSDTAKKEIITYLEGLFSEDRKKQKAALFTPFSGVQLKDSFKISSSEEDLSSYLEAGFPLTREGLEKLFMHRIFPISAAFGEDYFKTALLIHKKMLHYFQHYDVSLEGLLEYLSIVSESFPKAQGKSNVHLLTVHKAKGSQFDYVIYLPADVKERVGSYRFIAEKILEVSGRNVREEVEGEDSRIDFVACTRAKKGLEIIVKNDKHKKQFYLEDLTEYIVSKEEEVFDGESPHKYIQAWREFVAGRFDSAKELLKKNKKPWLFPIVKEYFAKKDYLSYSSVVSMQEDPFKFLVEKIIGVEQTLPQTDFGKRVHKIFELYWKGLPYDIESEEEEIAFKNMLGLFEELREKYPGLRFKQGEESFMINAKEMFGDGPDVNLLGYIDAVFEWDGGILLVDYKTNARTNKERDHRRQLSVYRRAYAAKHGLPVDKVSCEVLYVYLRGRVNTGEVYSQAISENKKGLEKKFFEWLVKAAEYIERPSVFLDVVFSKHYNERFGAGTHYLYEALKKVWEEERVVLKQGVVE